MDMTWYTRDLPVLTAALQFLEEHDYTLLPEVSDLAPIIGLDEMDVAKALKALDGEYLETHTTLGGLTSTTVEEVLPAGRRAAGQWPTPELVAERLVAGLEAAAANESDPERKSKLKQTSIFLGSAGKDLLINLVASVIARSAGLG
jgi:hypothetical protein